MKKSLLIVLAVALTLSVTAQQKISTSAKRLPAPEKRIGLFEQMKKESPSTLPGVLLNNSNRVASGANGVLGGNTAVIDTLGQGPTYRTNSIDNRVVFSYSPSTNALCLIHHSRTVVTGDPNSGFYRVDISTDGGMTWLKDQGPVNDDTIYICNYPEAVISDILGVPYIAWGGFFYDDNFYGGRLRGQSSGATKLNSLGTQHVIDTISPFVPYCEDIFAAKNGDIWKVAQMFDTAVNTYNYLDSIVVDHGVWNSGTNMYDYTAQSIRVENDTETFGGIIDANIVFDDGGQVGYIAMINSTKNLGWSYPDSSYFLSVLKTTNGGVSWSYAAANPGSAYHPEIIDISHCVDTLLYQTSDPVNNHYCPYNQLDAVVDSAGELHILVTLFYGDAFTVYYGDSLWGVFDVYSTSGGAAWKAKKIAQPVTLSGTFGDGSSTNPTSTQYNRVFASRNWEGNKLFFSWFDTDTVNHGVAIDGRNNISPDLWSCGYDVATGLWTTPRNLTQNTDADGSCTFAGGTYYVIDSAGSGTSFSIPSYYMQLQGIQQTGSPVQFWYIRDANVNMALATNPGNEVTVPFAPEYVHPINKSELFTVSANYPNPFKGKTSFDVNLSQSSDVTIEITNILGEVLSMNKYSNLNSGLHTLTIDCSKFTAGVYMYKVKAGDSVVTRKMTIQ